MWNDWRFTVGVRLNQCELTRFDRDDVRSHRGRDMFGRARRDDDGWRHGAAREAVEVPLTPHDARDERGVKHLDSDDAREVVVEPDFPCPILACAEVPGELRLGATHASRAAA